MCIAFILLPCSNDFPLLQDLKQDFAAKGGCADEINLLNELEGLAIL